MGLIISLFYYNKYLRRENLQTVHWIPFLFFPYNKVRDGKFEPIRILLFFFRRMEQHHQVTKLYNMFLGFGLDLNVEC